MGKQLDGIFALMTVMKFGGAVLGDAEGFLRMTRILERSEGALVVVSALATTTRDLEAAARTAAAGDVETALNALEEIRSTHLQMVDQIVRTSALQDAGRSELNQDIQELRRILEGVSVTRQITPRTLDRVLAFGERFALTLAHYTLLDTGLDATAIDATDLLVTSDTFGQATPIVSKSRIRIEKSLIPLLSQHRFVVTQGFIGATERGEPTTMGRESSNLSATMMASLINAKQVVVWTDVAGVRSTDPELVTSTTVRPHLSFAQARHAAHHGLKLLYKTMIDPAEEAGIPISIRSMMVPDGEHTEIDGTTATVDPIVTLSDVPGESTKKVTILFCDTQTWLTSLAHAAPSLNEPEGLYVVSDPKEEAVTIHTNPLDALLLTRLLHDHLTTARKETA